MKNVPELFGNLVFNEETMRQRLPQSVFLAMLRSIEEGKEIDPAIADTVANAMKDWAIEKGATHYTHWFQPLTGMTAEKHDAFIAPVSCGQAVMEFSGKELIKGEPDASSFPSGGLRATFEARGYTAWDPASFAFVRDATLYIPTAFCSYTGEALDEKTPLLRSMDALSAAGVRLLRLFGDAQTERIEVTVGAEQEYFITDAALFCRRKDLLYTGRTLFGAPAPKGQELEDHYFGPLKTRIGKFMAEADEELWRLGVFAKTKHNEVAPGQHELAPVFVTLNLAADQNLLVMSVLKRVAERHGLACLLHEKPYEGVNGSGKHNNWSLRAKNGKNLLSPGKTPAETKRFLLFFAAVLQAVDDYQDLLRVSTAYAGNDHRLGAHEAPPAIVSVFVGEDLQAVIDAVLAGTDYAAAAKGQLNLGVPSVPIFTRDATDRNRTSPFAFTGNKFEFRMPGASQNIALPNTVLNTAVAESFCRFADVLEAAPDFDAALSALLCDTLSAHRRIIFNGNGYSPEWEAEAARRGLSDLRDSVAAYAVLSEEKNIRLFADHGVMSRAEVASRQEILYENYANRIHIEARTMLEMAMRDILPAVSRYVGELAATAAAKTAAVKNADVTAETDLIARLSALTGGCYRAAAALRAADEEAKACAKGSAGAAAFRDLVLPAMRELRRQVDEAETLTDAACWPMPTYGELMFRV